SFINSSYLNHGSCIRYCEFVEEVTNDIDTLAGLDSESGRILARIGNCIAFDRVVSSNSIDCWSCAAQSDFRPDACGVGDDIAYDRNVAGRKSDGWSSFYCGIVRPVNYVTGNGDIG